MTIVQSLDIAGLLRRSERPAFDAEKLSVNTRLQPYSLVEGDK
jgi:hypothetical protein